MLFGSYQALVPYRAKETFTNAFEKQEHIDTRRTHLTFGARTHVGQTRRGYFRWLGWKEANNSALSQAARTQKCLHTQRRLDYFGKTTSLLFCFMGQRGGGGGGELVVFFSAALRYGGAVCALVRKEAAVRSIHPLRRFPAECDVRAGKWAGLRILGLLWIWHELGPRLLWTWWMYYLIFLSLLTSSWKGSHGHSVCVWWVSPAWPFWILMMYNNDCNNRASSTGTFSQRPTNRPTAR